jgi:hypothetical protein
MKPQKYTTEDTEKKSFRFLKSPVNSMVVSFQKRKIKNGIKRLIR